MSKTTHFICDCPEMWRVPVGVRCEACLRAYRDRRRMRFVRATIMAMRREPCALTPPAAAGEVSYSEWGMRYLSGGPLH